MTQSTERFSNRVENYIHYRPHYPLAIIDCLQTHCHLTKSSVIADVGSGTGILTALFLRNGNVVYGIEPNREMREAGERLLQHYTGFKSVVGPAEATTLPSHSVDFVTAGQAFHWFNRDKAKAEFKRILQPQGWVILIWNERRTASPFALQYEQLLRDYATDYAEVNHKRIDDNVLHEFFTNGFQHDTFENVQKFDFAGLKGRTLSSSYTPEIGHPQHTPMLAALQEIFNAHQNDGRIVFEYDTNIYYGQLD